MRKFILLALVAWCARCGATTYYVSSSSGNDLTGNGTPNSPWQTFGGPNNHINSGSFNPGDSIYLKRGDTWNEPLIPPSNGSSGNPITFDAYGNGAAPVITAATPITFVSGSWTYVSGNAWKAQIVSNLPSAGATANMVQFGSLYGRKQPYGSGCASSIVSKYDWCVSWPWLYVYSGNSSTNPVTTYASDGAIVPIVAQAAGLAMIAVAGNNWITFQHIKVQSFDYAGVSVTGGADNLVFANMEVDGMIPYGTTPFGFYVNATSPGNIQFLSDDAHLNYDGFRFDGAASAITVKNCRGYANRDTGLKDNTGKVTYSYSHFYGNNLAQFPASDVVGGIAGSGNVSSAIAPVVTNFSAYPARFSFTVDDVGSAAGTEAYINSFLTMFSSRGISFNAAVVPSYTVDWTSVNSWYGSGNEIDSHSWSHQYYTTNTNPQNATPYPNAPALDIRYTGSGTAATLSIAGTILSTTVTGAPGDSISSIDLSTGAYDTMAELKQYLAGLAHYTVTYDAGGPLVRPNTHSVNLQNVSNQDIKSATYVMVYDQTKLVPDELSSSKSSIQANVPGLSETFYVYPDGIEDPTIEADAVAAGYTAARGSLAMKGQDNTTASANSLYSNGVNVQNITSVAAIQIHGMTQAQVNQMVGSLVFRARAWGVPYGLFTHNNSRGDGTPDISNTELGWLLDAVTANGGTWLTNTVLASAIKAGTGFSGTSRYIQNPTGTGVNLANAAANSPTVGTGTATSYPVDLSGVDRSVLGAWDVGASAYLSQRYGAGGGAGSTAIGGWPTAVTVALPQTWVNSNEWVGTTTNSIVFPSSGSGGGWSCGATNYGPYTAGSQASLQQAINDAETCRAANGSGTTITIPGGTVYSANPGLTLPQSAGDTSSTFIVLQSSTPLPVGQTVCSHGIQDNVATSVQPGIRNLGCDGSSMSYQLGMTVTPVSGAFTLANGAATSSSAYDDVASMYTIECAGNNCNAVQTAAADANGVGPHHFAILNAEIRPQAGLAAALAPVAIGQGTETAVSQIPAHIHLAYDYLHGDWTDAAVSGGVATAGPTGANSLPNDVSMNCIGCSISYSYVDRSLRPGAEGHVAAVKLGQNLKFVHNWFEGQSSGVFCGGWSAAIPIMGFVTCRDVEDRANRYTYPYSWMLAWQAQLCVNGLSCGGNSYVRKNAHESKFSQRYLLDGNILENVDNSGAQNGTIMSWKTDNTSGGPQGNNYWISQTDVTATNNIERLSCNGPNWGSRSASAGGNGGGVTNAPQRAAFTNNLLYGVNTNNPGCSVTGFTSTPQYGFRFGTGGNGNAWAATAQRDAAGLTTTLTLTSQPGQLQTDAVVGDPVQVSGCSDATFNTSATTLGPPALPGTNPSGLAVVYANPGTANASTTGCTFNNIQGYGRYLTYLHDSSFLSNLTYSNDPQNGANGGSAPYSQSRNVTFTNDIFVGGGINSTFGEGTRTTTKAYDPSTLVLNNDLFPGRDVGVTCPGHSTGAGGMAACYTEYSATSAAINPPTTLYGTPTSYCNGNDPTTENCAGIVGAMSQGSFPAMLNDWHQYRLCHAGDAACNSKASVYSASGAYNASDAGDLGVDVGAIEAAQTVTYYGAGDSYPDLPPVSPLLFGVHYNQTTTPFPAPNFSAGFPVIRLWDTSTGWADLQAGPNCTNTATSDCTFTKLDTWLGKFGANAQIILTLGKVPNFDASGCGAGSTQNSCTGTGVTQSLNCNYPPLGTPNGSCTPPKDLNCDGTGTDATWIQFLTALWNHTGVGKIQYLEIWNEWNVNGFWDNPYISTKCSGYTDPTMKMLIRMTQDAQCVLQGKNCNAGGTYPKTAMDPEVKIMSPPVAGAGPNNQAFNLNGLEYKLLADGIANYVDLISVHGYLVNSTCTPPANSGCSVPETIDAGLNVLKADMATFGINKPIFISEFSWGAVSGTVDPQYEQAFVSRYYTLIAQKGIANADWYYLSTGSNDCTIGPVLQGQNGTICPTGSAVQVIQSWLAGATFLQTGFTKTARNDCAAGSNVYEFPMVLPDQSLARIVYYDGIANTASCAYGVAGQGFVHYQDMTGASHSLSGVTSIVLDNRAVLLTVE
ncbi:MAG TPA: hypothetical protein VE377_13135 [Candidatus Dormibacteraeota bacterium]|nr:hypothetical protein [Candidatus Dormibacteraeota bacterium]